MGQIVFQATLGGQTALVGQNTASSFSLNLPLASDTLVGKATTDTFTNKTISGSSNTLSNIGNSALTNSSLTIGSTAISLGATASTVSGLTLTSPTINTATLNSYTAPNSTNSTTFGFKNRIIDAGFIVNQRSYTSGTALSSGSYGHDRWKGGGSGGTYTFTQSSLGVPIQITITAGSIQQVIEGCNLPEGGTYVLSWAGSAQASINGGTAGSSPLTVTGTTAGANMTIQFNTGTVQYPQLEVGTNATNFDYRPYGTEFALCQRYYQVMNPISVFSYFSGASQSLIQNFNFPVTMRAAPTVTITSNGTTSNFSSIGTLGTTVNGTSIQVVGAGAGQGGCYNAVGNAAIEL